MAIALPVRAVRIMRDVQASVRDDPQADEICGGDDLVADWLKIATRIAVCLALLAAFIAQKPPPAPLMQSRNPRQ